MIRGLAHVAAASKLETPRGDGVSASPRPEARELGGPLFQRIGWGHPHYGAQFIFLSLPIQMLL